MTNLWDACRNGDFEYLKEYISGLGNINLQNKSNYNRTPLIYACMGGNWDLVDFLISNGADSDIQDEVIFNLCLDRFFSLVKK